MKLTHPHKAFKRAQEGEDGFAALRAILSQVKEGGGKILLQAADIADITPDNQEKAAGLQKISVHLKPLVSAAERDSWHKQGYDQKVADIQNGLRLIRQSAVDHHHEIPSRDTNALKASIAAHMALLHKDEMHFHRVSEMEKMICAELEATIRAVYDRQKQDGQGLEIPHLLETFGAYGTFNHTKEHTTHARQAVDRAFVEIVQGMNAAQRDKMAAYIARATTPDLQKHIAHALKPAHHIEAREEPTLQV